MKLNSISKLFSFVLFLCGFSVANAQNSVWFDGVNDEIKVTNASALISGATGMSISFWVNSRHTPGAFPDYGGLCGFRNDANADFYVIHLSSSLEFRFRNSSGINFTLTTTGIPLNTWQHFAMTYDGSKLRIYKNASAIDSVAASGTITSAVETFFIGKLPYTSANFYFGGQMDEVSLWNSALSSSQIACIYQHSVDPAHINLKLYFPLDQGIAGGINTNDTMALDQSNHLDGRLYNFTLDGDTSNWVGGVQNFSSAEKIICPGTSYNFLGQIIDTVGTYIGYAPIGNGCDSIVSLMLSFMDTSVTLVSTELHAGQDNASYQWKDCSTGNAVTGATSQDFTPSATGDYRCEIYIDGITCETECLHYIWDGQAQISKGTHLSIYPNPVQDQLTLEHSKNVSEFTLRIFDVMGKVVYQQSFSDHKKLNLDVRFLNSGFYFLEKRTADSKSTYTFVKQ